MITLFLFALVATLSIEVPVLLFSIRFSSISKEITSDNSILFAGLIASSLTLPYLYFVLPGFFEYGSFPHLFFGEIGVTLVEGVFYSQFFRINLKKGLLLSLVANVTSFTLGLIFF